MGVFEDVTLKWEIDGQMREFKIPHDQVMQAIAVIEDHITLSELGVVLQRRAAPLARLAGAYAALLRFAGADLTQEQVYAQLFSRTNSGVGSAQIAGVVNGLLMLMIPPDNLKASKEDTRRAGKGKRSAA